MKEKKISKKLFTWLYSITNNNKLYIWFKYVDTSLWNTAWPQMVYEKQLKYFNGFLKSRQLFWPNHLFST